MCQRIRYEFVQSRISVCATLGVSSGSNHCRRYCAKLWFVQSRLLVENRKTYPRHRIDRRFEPGSQGETPSAFWFFLQKQKERKNVSLSGAFHCMESMPLSGRHAARAMKLRGFANLDSVRRFATFPGGQAAYWTFPDGNISLFLKKQDKIRGVGAPPPTG